MQTLRYKIDGVVFPKNQPELKLVIMFHTPPVPGVICLISPERSITQAVADPEGALHLGRGASGGKGRRV